jgi:hypothetical protein
VAALVRKVKVRAEAELAASPSTQPATPPAILLVVTKLLRVSIIVPLYVRDSEELAVYAPIKNRTIKKLSAPTSKHIPCH